MQAQRLLPESCDLYQRHSYIPEKQNILCSFDSNLLENLLIFCRSAFFVNFVMMKIKVFLKESNSNRQRTFCLSGMFQFFLYMSHLYGSIIDICTVFLVDWLRAILPWFQKSFSKVQAGFRMLKFLKLKCAQTLASIPLIWKICAPGSSRIRQKGSWENAKNRFFSALTHENRVLAS